MEFFFTTLAFLLDSMPAEGRLMLLALLLSIAFAVFAHALESLPAHRSSAVNVVYRKAVLACLLGIPLLVYTFNIRLPVAVVEITQWDTPLPAAITWSLLVIWLVGVIFQLVRLLRELTRTRLIARVESGEPSAHVRLTHWQQRLNYRGQIGVCFSGAEGPWHIGGHIGGHIGALQADVQSVVILPTSALHWPKGVIDVMLLTQMAALKQRAWFWLIFGRVIQALYWPAPWVASLVADLGRMMIDPAMRLAQAAYRDPEGWRRDIRNFEQRVAALGPDCRHLDLLRLPFIDGQAVQQALSASAAPRLESFAARRAWVRQQRQEHARDPHEQAYWLIAAASILVATATTLTQVLAPPDEDYVPLLQQWETTMLRTVGEYDDTDENAEEISSRIK